MRHVLIAVLAVAGATCHAETLEIIDLLHLSAPEFAAALAGGGASVADTLEAEATDFAVDAMHYAAEQTRGRTGPVDPLVVSRAGAVASGVGDLSGLLPEGLEPPMAAPNRNALAVRGERDAIDELREIIAMLDVPTPMVNVELAMDGVSTSQAREIDPSLRAWGWGAEVSAGETPAPALGFAVGNLRGLLGYESGRARGRSLTATNVTGMSGQPMVISVGEVRPQIRSQVYYDPWGRRTVEYWTEAIFAGVTFWVLPTVNNDDTVTMVLRPMLSEVVGPAAQVGAGEVIQRALVETTVRVPDGQSLVIGGLDRRADELSRSFPLSVGEMRSDRSSVISVTPRIIRTMQR